MLRIDELGERIPLTIAGSDGTRGTIPLLFQVVGENTTRQLSGLNVGDYILDVVGPSGTSTHIESMGLLCVLVENWALHSVMPIARALYEAGNHVISVISARNKDLPDLRKKKCPGVATSQVSRLPGK